MMNNIYRTRRLHVGVLRLELQKGRPQASGPSLLKVHIRVEQSLSAALHWQWLWFHMKQFYVAGRLTIYFKSTLVTENNISLRMYFAQIFHTHFFFKSVCFFMWRNRRLRECDGGIFEINNWSCLYLSLFPFIRRRRLLRPSTS